MNGSLKEAKLVQLSVIIDGRLDSVRARQVAILADRLGLAGVWLRQPWPLAVSAVGWDPLAASAVSEDPLAEPGSGLRIPPGIIVDADAADAADAANAADTGWLNRVRTPRRIALTGTPAAIARWQQLIGPGVDLAVSLPAGDSEWHAVFIPCAPGRDLAAEVSAAVAVAAGRPVLAEVAVSVGRTAAEARARADMDELFAPDQQGLFGTLEECQATAARLGQAGVTELVCCLPLASDLPDVLAQVRSIAIGAAVLRPGEPPSAAPPPPAGWGGRRSRW